MLELSPTVGTEAPLSRSHSEATPHHAPAAKPKRFRCQHCQRLFARLEHLQRHERTHTREKPFACDRCDQRFTRSDLLNRHERLSHSADRPSDANDRRTSRSRLKRSAQAAGLDHEPQQSQQQPIPSHSTTYGTHNPVSAIPAVAQQPVARHELPLETLSLAAEQAAMQGMVAAAPAMPTNMNVPMPYTETDRFRAGESMAHGVEFENSLDSLAAYLDAGPLSSHHFSAFINTEQPIPFFSPESAPQGQDTAHEQEQQHNHIQEQSGIEESGSFSRFGSRLPSLQPEESGNQGEKNESTSVPRKPLSDVSIEDRQLIATKLKEFASVIPPDFQLPSRLALSRYLAGYINGFHEHMPCLHVQTMTVQNTAIELLLAMAAVGTQYCFEGEKGVELFHISQEIAMRRIRRRDARAAAQPRSIPSQTSSPAVSGPLGLPAEVEPREDLMQTAQALFLLMAMATWAKHKEILREALAIQSILATLVREDGLKMAPLSTDDVSWEDWIRYETVKRTKFIVFCFFNLHCIVYNIPSLILSSELEMPLPCSAAEFKAPTAARWRETRKRSSVAEPYFQTAFKRLFDRSGRPDAESESQTSSLGNYVLIHALIQQIFFVRQVTRCRGAALGTTRDDPDEMFALEQALRNWQLGWKRNPESSLDPLDPNGPIAFNSTALLRLAYIRLNNIDTGPGHSLATRDPIQIAQSFWDSPVTGIRRTRKLVRAVLHSAHALSIPVKIGIRLVARTQTFTWSIQHSLCSLECAFLMCKWLEALALPNPQPEITEDERRICMLIKIMLDETEYKIRCDDEQSLLSADVLKQMSAGVLRVWAQIFKGAQTWAIVEVIGSALSIYADMLESSRNAN